MRLFEEREIDPMFSKYLKTLDLGEPTQDLKFLSRLYEASTYDTVWNNLKIVQKIKPSLDPKKSFISAYAKREGGTCLLLNLGFYYMADQLGLSPTLFSAFARATDDWVMEGITRESHIVNCIKEGQKEYIFDPGWGINPRKMLPLPLKDEEFGEVVVDEISTFRIKKIPADKDAEVRYAVQKKIGEQWITQYDFSKQPRTPEYFSDHLDYVYSDFPYNGKLFCFGRGPKTALIFSGGDHIKQISADGKSENFDLKKDGLKRALIDVFGLSEDYVNAINIDDFKPSAKDGLIKFWSAEQSDLEEIVSDL